MILEYYRYHLLGQTKKIFELRPLNPFIQISPIGCAALHSRLRYLLERNANPPLSSPSFSTIDDFLVRALYVTRTAPSYTTTSTSGLIANEDLQETYSANSTDSIQWFVPSQKQDIQVPRWICSHTAEIFFEGDRKGSLPDTDEQGLATSIITCLSRLPKDVRAKVVQAIVVVGGGAAIPGLRTRLHATLESMWKQKTRQAPVSTTPEGSPPPSPFAIRDTPLSVTDLTPRKKVGMFRFIAANPTETTFIGASLLGDVKVRGLVEVSREAFNSSQGRGVMDWTFVGESGEETVEESKRKSKG